MMEPQHARRRLARVADALLAPSPQPAAAASSGRLELRSTAAATMMMAASEREQELRAAAAACGQGPGARAGLAELAYNNWSGEHRGITARPLVGPGREDLLPAVQPRRDGLSDDEVRGFCARGFLVVAPKKTAAFHAANFEEFERNQGAYGGNNGSYGMHMEGLKAIYDDEAVQSALCSLLGPGCVMHQHNATHKNGPGSTNQSWHKDPYGPEAAVRHKHAFRICMALYYPQRTTLAIGPTGIIPGRYSHTVVSSTDCSEYIRQAPRCAFQGCL